MKRVMKLFLFFLMLLIVAGCATHRPVVLDPISADSLSLIVEAKQSWIHFVDGESVVIEGIAIDKNTSMIQPIRSISLCI